MLMVRLTPCPMIMVFVNAVVILINRKGLWLLFLMIVKIRNFTLNSNEKYEF